MAKSKDDTPKKGKKSTTVQKAATTLRRSPRKAVLSAKKLATAETLSVGKVIKQPAAKKTTAARKTPPKNAKETMESGQKKTKSPSPAKVSPKKATKTTRTSTKNPKSPPATKDATLIPNAEPPTSPRRRGRPRKEATTKSTKSKSGTADRGRISSRTRARTPDDAAEVPMPVVEAKWTDSPKKRSPSKTSPKKTASKTKHSRNMSINDVPETALGGIRQSIEWPEGEARGRARTSGRKATKTSSPARSKSPTKARGRRKSSTSATSRSTTRSKSPAKSGLKRPSGSAIPSENISTMFTKARSPVLQSPRLRGRPRSSSTGSQGMPLRIEKTRASRSPAKSPAAESRRVRSASPVKALRNAVRARRSSDPAPSPGKSRSASPRKQSGSHTQRARGSSGQTAFESRFLANDDYGRSLRQVEKTAYQYDKAGQDAMAGRHPQVSKEDEALAKERGIRRARLEKHLNTEGGVIPRRAQEHRSRSPAKGRQSMPGLNDELDGSTHTTSARSSSNRARTSSNSQRSPNRTVDRSRSSASRSSKSAADDDAPLSKGQPSAEGRGANHSVTNPEFIPDTSTRRKNPFFETMPAPEVWHRRMPPFLPFGETPFMEREMSRQITEDLAKGE